MKTAISLPDDLFAAVEEEAVRLGISRSEVFARAARAYLERRAPDSIRASYDRAYGEAECEAERAPRHRAARAAMRDVEW